MAASANQAGTVPQPPIQRLRIIAPLAASAQQAPVGNVQMSGVGSSQGAGAPPQQAATASAPAAATAGPSVAAATGPQVITGTGALPFENLPSAGMLFQPAVRQAAMFVAEVRADLEHPVHLDIVPRGFDNPMMLCYRNSVLTALLNTNRFLTFLHAHMRQSRRYYSHSKVSGHLLTRLYHLAVAYWDRDGRHPMEPNDDYERLLTLFWRACKWDDIKDNNAGTGANNVFACWLTFCDQQPDQDSNLALFQRQQDATHLLSWMLRAIANQLDWYPEQYGQGQSLRNYDSMFEAHTTVRFVCHLCRNPARLRRPDVGRSIGLAFRVFERQPRPGARAQRLLDIMERDFNALLDGGRFCNRCRQNAIPTRALRRLQATPELLTVQLLRMCPDATGACTKMNDVIDFPQYLDVSRWLEPHVYGTNSRVVYRLASVISHRGDGNKIGGHYVTFARRGEPTQGFQQPCRPVVAWGAMNDDRKLQSSIDARMRAEGARRPAPGQPVGQSTGPFDDFWPVPAKSKVRELEAEDSNWVRISDKDVVENVPFRKITNTSRDDDHNVNSAEWFDPILLLYEKWIEEYEEDFILRERVFQQPMNMGLGQDNDNPLPEQCPPAVVAGEPAWVYADDGDGNGGSGAVPAAGQNLFAGEPAKPAAGKKPQIANKSSKRRRQPPSKPQGQAKRRRT